MYIIWHSSLYIQTLYSHVAMYTFNTVCEKTPEKEHEQVYSERVHY